LSERTEKLRKKARGAFKAGEYEEAIQFFQRLVENRDETEAVELRVSDHLSAGVAFARLTRHVEAVQEFEAVIALDPVHASAHARLGQELVRVGRPTQAYEILRQAAKLAPTEANVHWELSKVARALGEDHVADLAMAACLTLDPEHEEARLTQVARSPGPVTQSTAATSDSAFADLLEFVQSRPGADAPPARTLDLSYRPLVNVLLGAAAYMAVFLVIRFSLIG
jgi:tetratricopeptide (TPR) repeat protein